MRFMLKLVFGPLFLAIGISLTMVTCAAAVKYMEHHNEEVRDNAVLPQ